MNLMTLAIGCILVSFSIMLVVVDCIKAASAISNKHPLKVNLIPVGLTLAAGMFLMIANLG